MNLDNNTILITGGTSGFGLELTKRFIALGNQVIITGRNQAKLDEVKKQIPQVHTIQNDVGNAASIIELYEKVTTQFPKLNFLINNAGEMRKMSLHDTSIGLDDINREIAINLSGPIRMVQQFLPHLKKQLNPAILNVSSGIAYVPSPYSPIYSASKAGLHFYTVSLRVQLQKTKIKVFELVAPAASTPLNDQFVNVDGFNPKLLATPEKIIDATIKGLKKDSYEIAPGFGRILRIMSRLAPKLILKEMSKVGANIYSQP
ncbi:SDR family NAD(P)-dependent oxidoreductase [Pedobacter hiemivivus]|uniref:SDR family NAD(P)-dependent oxidoreductase n=1 Tax=Pedobacter hiemivivus TaxID=2530454 RepID=A0A4U1GGZ3_9SPHI|nr:SDR family NAD(P)-dependent oxidoreductase [Pedobacter hiemivivus]TKC62399.1 SDR family NAD(P)-dependent oxidoreductase [Pedobacter hiemivivus]